MAKKRDKIVGLVNSLFDVERQVVDLLLDAVPEEVRKHARAARKEKLLTIRALLDAQVRRLEEQERKTKRKGPQKVDLD